MTLQVAGFLEHSTVNGRGLRSVLFLAGCPHHCPGCHNEEMQAYDYGETVEVSEILNRLLKNKPLIDGITLSGGEPFEQCEALIPLVQSVKAQQLNVWCYTGYTYSQLLKDPKKQALLSLIDVLVDGPFMMTLKDPNLKFRGSSNQHLYALRKGKIEAILDDAY